MKKKLSTITFLLLCYGQYGFSQTVEVTGKLASTDTIQVILSDLYNMFKQDTSVTHDGSFHLRMKSSGAPMRLDIFNRKTGQKTRRDFFADHGEVTLGSDTTLNFQYPDLQLKYTWFYRKVDINGYLSRISAAHDAAELQKVAGEFKDACEPFVRENSNNLVGAYVFCGIFFNGASDVAKLDSLYDLFSPDVLARSALLQSYGKRLELMHGLPSGILIPSFTAYDSMGQLFNSTSLQGKYAVLDFWGSWCIPCMAEMPRLRTYYGKYKDRITLVGINCNDDQKKWTETIKSKNMTWLQVQDDPSTQLKKKLKVYYLPTKILIDPQGKIIKVFTGGGDDDFYQALDQLITK